MTRAKPPRPGGLRVLPFTLGGHRFAVLVEDPERTALPRGITPAEQAIGNLVRRGLSNRAIAAQRGTSPRTVANQIASLMRKLGADSRVQLALRLSPSAHNKMTI